MVSGKRLVGCLAAVVCAAPAVLGGCGGEASDLVEESPEPTEPTEPTAPTEPTGSPTPPRPVALTWYTVPDSGAQVSGRIADECVKASGGGYTLRVNQLAPDPTGQRAQLKTLLAAGESADLISTDQSLLGDFAAAGHLAPLPASDRARLRGTMLSGALAGSTYEGTIVAFPWSVNTQLLWFRKSMARKANLDLSRPVTWDRVIRAAESARTTVQAQGRRYEGYVVWLNALIAGAGGRLVAPDSKPGRAAARVIRQLAASRAADRGLDKTTELETHQRFFAGRTGFVVNWPYLWSMRRDARWKTDDLGWALYPRTTPDRPARPPIGGVSLAVPASSKHRALALSAARCLTSKQHQIEYMLSQDVLSGLAGVYDDPRVRKAYPMADLLRESLRTGAPRPVIAKYDEVSAALQRTFWPPRRVDPKATPRAAQRAVDAALR